MYFLLHLLDQFTPFFILIENFLIVFFDNLTLL